MACKASPAQGAASRPRGETQRGGATMPQTPAPRSWVARGGRRRQLRHRSSRRKKEERPIRSHGPPQRKPSPQPCSAVLKAEGQCCCLSVTRNKQGTNNTRNRPPEVATPGSAAASEHGHPMALSLYPCPRNQAFDIQPRGSTRALANDEKFRRPGTGAVVLLVLRRAMWAERIAPPAEI